jgi:lipopolysaccharide/colanic/teichoic acid biosynthesis glycosyltransferase
MKTNDIYIQLNITNSFYSRVVKRLLDFSLSLTAILVLSVALIIIYFLTFLFLGRPVIYKQLRPGKDHKTFCIYKFRSMTNKKDENGKLLPDEQRITAFGKFLRKTSLDELPQLFNILKGDMSFVGPRPRLVKDMMFYDKDVFDYYIMRPGLTGLTQVSGRNENSWEQVFEKDREYVQNITFWGDVKIFFKTFTSVFFSTGETHDNSEEDKKVVHEYYYADYALRTQKITKEKYDLGLSLAKQITNSNETLVFHSELFEPKETEQEQTKQEQIEQEQIEQNIESSIESSETTCDDASDTASETAFSA